MTKIQNQAKEWFGLCFRNWFNRIEFIVFCARKQFAMGRLSFFLNLHLAIGVNLNLEFSRIFFKIKNCRPYRTLIYFNLIGLQTFRPDGAELSLVFLEQVDVDPMKAPLGATCL